MNYPLLIVVPVLMILDYYLTIQGAHLYKRLNGLDDPKEYELNPVFQKSVSLLHRVDLNHVLSVAIVTGILILLSEKNLVTHTTLEFLVGSLAIPLAAVNGRHLANILTFLYSAKHPSEITGQSHVTAAFSIKMSQYHMLFLLLPLLIIGLAQPTSFVFGGIAATIMLILYHQIWLAQSKKT